MKGRNSSTSELFYAVQLFVMAQTMIGAHARLSIRDLLHKRGRDGNVPALNHLQWRFSALTQQTVLGLTTKRQEQSEVPSLSKC